MTDNSQHHTLTYRPDIDGLRAVAIVLVIVFHAFPKLLRGGFIGVDIFFVISGYLITSIILRGQAENRFSLVEFYSRRIRRIFPALIVVLLFCLVAGWLVLLPTEYQQLGRHIAAGSIYLSNFALQNESGYFDTGTDLKPLLHLWSLSIEEQFYLVFPVLLIITQRFNVNALLPIALLLSVSFVLNVRNIEAQPSAVFFFPYTRAWELLIGSSVAAFNRHSAYAERQSTRSANRYAWFGLTLILLAWYFFNNQHLLFPSGWALIPTVGTACIIFATEKAWFNRKILASKTAIFIGLISYPLYLWHWVLLSFLRITEMEKPSPMPRIIALLLSIVLAWATYLLIEKRIRFHKNQFISIGLLSSLLLIGFTGYQIQQQHGFPNRITKPMNWTAGDIGNEVYQNKGWVSQKACIEKYGSVDFEHFPKDEFCLIQDADHAPTALLLGDSHANHLYAGLTPNTTLTGGNLLNLGAGGCFPFYDNPKNPNPNCRELIDHVLEMAISSPSIKTLILTTRAITEINEESFIASKDPFEALKTHADAPPEKSPYEVLQLNMKKTLSRLTATSKKIIFILDIPELEFEPIACLNRPWRLSGQASKTPCAVPRAQVDALHKPYLELVTPILKAFPTVTVLDPLGALCDADYCGAIKDHKMLYRDNNHLNEVGAAYVGAYFQSLGVH